MHSAARGKPPQQYLLPPLLIPAELTDVSLSLPPSPFYSLRPLSHAPAFVPPLANHGPTSTLASSKTSPPSAAAIAPSRTRLASAPRGREGGIWRAWEAFGGTRSGEKEGEGGVRTVEAEEERAHRARPAPLVGETRRTEGEGGYGMSCCFVKGVVDFERFIR